MAYQHHASALNKRLVSVTGWAKKEKIKMTWLVVIVVVAIIGAIIGAMSSENGKKGEGAMSGCLGAGGGCAYIIFQIFLALVGLWILIKIGSWLFG